MTRLQILPVSALNHRIREVIEADDVLRNVWVEGEVSSISRPASGHIYLKLKDADSVIDATMWRSVVSRQSFIPRVGDQVAAHGAVTVYEKGGRYQLSVDVIHPAGAGLLQLELERLRQRLDAEGLFDEGRKRRLPQFPQRIGVVTSATGAVWHDIQRVVARRYPLAELVLAPSLVQGDGAAESIVSALDCLEREADIDIIIVARGGGSVEDLWCFNDERVVRAIFASRVPVVSAIGHETDVSLADYVADVRAATPSVAAEMAVPNLLDIATWLEAADRAVRASTIRYIGDRRTTLRAIANRLLRVSPVHTVSRMSAETSALEVRLTLAHGYRLATISHQIDRVGSVLQALSPFATLRRGYSFLTIDDDDRPVTSISQATNGSRLTARVTDGVVRSTVVESSSRPGISRSETR